MVFSLASLGVLVLYGLTLPRTRWQLIIAFLLTTTLTILTIFYAISNHFTGEGITVAVIAHLGYGLQSGELGIGRFPTLVIGVIGALLGILIWARLCWQRWLERQIKDRYVLSQPMTWLMTAAAGFSLPLQPAAFDLYLLKHAFTPTDIRLSQDLAWLEAPDLSKAKRPIVYLYLESFEATFLDDSLFPGLTPNLNRLRKEALVIEGIVTSPFMNWTMAGMIASQCGMPMSTLPTQDNDNIEKFRPGVDCIGDILSRNQYKLSYIGGADLEFSGKGNFYRKHGFEFIVGYDELRSKLGETMPHSDWGAFDDTVFSTAQEELLRLKSSNQNFGLFLLTTATHPHSGYPSPSCDLQNSNNFNNPMLNSVHCSDKQVYEFIRWLQINGPEDLLIIIASDHLQVAGDASKLLHRSKNRHNLFMVLGNDISPKTVRRSATMVDVAPTVASLIGFGMQSIGIGRNLLFPEPTLAERYGISQFNAMLPQWRINIRQENVY